MITSKEPSVPHKAFQDSLTAVLNQVHDVDYPAVLKLVSQPAPPSSPVSAVNSIGRLTRF